MNSFLLGAYGTLFATHRSLYYYGHEHHGVDFEHNLVVVDGGGWPAHDKTNSCGDDNSTLGVLVGLALGGFADYVRGDAKWSYRDNTVLNDNPAIRAERACLFVKAGPTPYLLVVDDIQFRADPHRYDWLWHAPDLPVAGAGTLSDPLVISGGGGRCAIHFLQPVRPVVTIKPAEEPRSRRRSPLKRIAVTQRGVRVRYAVVATLEKAGDRRPVVRAETARCDGAQAGAASVRLPDGSADLLVWQSEEDRLQRGHPLVSGKLATDALTAMVRVRDGKVVGYVLGEGTYLRWGDVELVRAREPVCVSAGAGGVEVFGRRRAREGLPPVRPAGVKVFRPRK